jgi:hypothetical protein
MFRDGGQKLLQCRGSVDGKNIPQGGETLTTDSTDDTDHHGLEVMCFNTLIGLPNLLFPGCFHRPDYNGSSSTGHKSAI